MEPVATMCPPPRLMIPGKQRLISRNAPMQFAVIIAGIVLTLLELFICFLQAFIFTFLTVLFISLVASHHDNDHLEEHPFTDEDQMDLDKIADPQRITPMPDPAG